MEGYMGAGRAASERCEPRLQEECVGTAAELLRYRCDTRLSAGVKNSLTVA